MTRGYIPFEPGLSWLTAKTMAVVLSLAPNGVQHRFHPDLGQFIATDLLVDADRRSAAVECK